MKLYNFLITPFLRIPCVYAYVFERANLRQVDSKIKLYNLKRMLSASKDNDERGHLRREIETAITELTDATSDINNILKKGGL